MSSIYEELASHVHKIFNEDNVEIQFNKIEFKYEKRKHSTNKSIVVYIDDIPLTRSQLRTYKVEYKCRCNSINNILLYKYAHKKRIICHHCLQNRSFEYSVYTEPYSIKKGLKTKSTKSQKSFDEYDDDFKSKYNKKHLTEQEFLNYLPYIYKINDTILSDELRKHIKYVYACPTNNQMKFTPKISFNNDKSLISIKNIALKCNACGKIFNIHIENLRNKNLNDIRCRSCNFNTIGYKKQKHSLLNATYQSKLEQKFLDYCYNYGIKVEDGIKIPYYFDGKNRTYITDYYLPEHKIILELKGCNPYFKNDKITGKLDAKNAAAANYAKANGLKFRFIRDYDLENFVKTLSNKLTKYDITHKMN